MHVSRIGFTPLKGTHHNTLDEVVLAAAGPVGDRVFCLVDLERRRVLRTVENPSLIAVRSAWDGHTLGIVLPDGTTLEAAPCDTGPALVADYWGRSATLRLQTGPHAEALGDYLGRPVRLARADPGEVVYGGSVSLVTTGALTDLAARSGERLSVQAARFRATVTLDTDRSVDTWPAGTRLTLGGATVELQATIPRCAVVDLDPETGRQTSTVLEALAGYGHGPGIGFGVDARVVVPGGVRQGDPALVEA